MMVYFAFPINLPLLPLQVPSRDQMTPNESLREFFEDVPALGLLGTPHCIYPQTPFVIDADVQLVCKYLKAYRIGGTKGIDRLYRESELTVWYTPSIRVRLCLAILIGVLPVRDS